MPSLDPLLEEELGLTRGGGGGGLSSVDFELEELEAFLDFLDFLLDGGLTTITPRANFCSFDRRGGGGGERK